ncbi:CAP domain-containing protein [Anaerolineales bacterium HSG6]|nr:CAP domain-containing protein [Anaerolineales bacterium HSG6]MDM8529580.1 CAP domain-containing protein [Anaerolineales bacterium HSG25]
MKLLQTSLTTLMLILFFQSFVQPTLAQTPVHTSTEQSFMVIPTTTSATTAKQRNQNYPSDPINNIPWTGSMATVADIEQAFNSARQAENEQLGLNIPTLQLPTEWNSLGDAEKALWLINQERADRGLMMLQGVEENVTQVAQAYAEYLLTNNAFSHTANGQNPWERLKAQSEIASCQDFLGVSENLAVFMTSGDEVALPIERAIYYWLYDDGDCCDWGHRHAILWSSYTDNNGQLGEEGFLGIGRARGPYSYNGHDWATAEMIVMNVFDPCADWGVEPEPTNYSFMGQITDSQGDGISEVLVSMTDVGETTTDANGVYIFEEVPIGEHQVVLTKTGCNISPQIFTVGVSTDYVATRFVVAETPAMATQKQVHLPLVVMR